MKQYEEAVMEVINLSEDVIRTSLGEEGEILTDTSKHGWISR